MRSRACRFSHQKQRDDFGQEYFDAILKPSRFDEGEMRNVAIIA